MKKYVYILFVLLSFSRLYTYAQNATIDSLKLALKNAKHDTIRVKLTVELGETIYLTEPKSAIDLWFEAIIICEKGLTISSLPSSRKFYLRYLAAAYNNIGYVYANQGEISKAINFYNKSLKIQEELKDEGGIASTLNNIGLIYKNQGDITNALDYYHKSLKIYEELLDKKGIATTLSNIGIIYNGQGEVQKSVEYFLKSLKIREEINDKYGIAHSLFKIGSIYMNNNDIPKALDYFGRSLNIREEVNDKEGIAYCLNSIGQIYNNQGKVTKALECFQKSLTLSEEIEDKKGMMSSFNFISEIMLQMGMIARAHEMASNGLQISRELGFPEYIQQASSTLKKVYQKQNKFKEAFAMYELEIQMRDSINNTETKKAAIKKQFQYQYEKQAAADSVKHAEEQKVKNAQLMAQAASLKQEKTQRYVLYGGLFLVMTFLGFVVNRFKITQKQKIIIEDQKFLVDNAYEHLHEKNKEVMDSIRYAKRIQGALITPEVYIDKQLNKLMKNK